MGKDEFEGLHEPTVQLAAKSKEKNPLKPY